MNIIRNISILILFFGIILMTIYITKSYSYDIDEKIKQFKRIQMMENKKEEIEAQIRKENSTKPSKIFDKMFSEPTVWMGYSDPNTINMNTDINTYNKVI